MLLEAIVRTPVVTGKLVSSLNLQTKKTGQAGLVQTMLGVSDNFRFTDTAGEKMAVSNTAKRRTKNYKAGYQATRPPRLYAQWIEFGIRNSTGPRRKGPAMMMRTAYAMHRKDVEKSIQVEVVKKLEKIAAKAANPT
jgi:hypothetical protein